MFRAQLLLTTENYTNCKALIGRHFKAQTELTKFFAQLASASRKLQIAVVDALIKEGEALKCS
jgi:hypothetical protein